LRNQDFIVGILRNKRNPNSNFWKKLERKARSELYYYFTEKRFSKKWKKFTHKKRGELGGQRAEPQRPVNRGQRTARTVHEFMSTADSREHGAGSMEQRVKPPTFADSTSSGFGALGQKNDNIIPSSIFHPKGRGLRDLCDACCSLIPNVCLFTKVADIV
jgi:hypothetical protein